MVSYSEFEKCTIAVMAAMHKNTNKCLIEFSLGEVLSGYNIALEEDNPLWDELITMTYGVML